MPTRGRALAVLVAVLAIAVTLLTLVLGQHRGAPVDTWSANEPSEGASASGEGTAVDDTTATRAAASAPPRTALSRPARPATTTSASRPRRGLAPGGGLRFPEDAPNPRIPEQDNLLVRVEDPERRFAFGATVVAVPSGGGARRVSKAPHEGMAALRVEIGHPRYEVRLEFHGWTLATTSAPGPQTMSDRVEASLRIPATQPYLVVRSEGARATKAEFGPSRLLASPVLAEVDGEKVRALSEAKPIVASRQVEDEFTYPLAPDSVDREICGVLFEEGQKRALVRRTWRVLPGRNDLGRIRLLEPVELVRGRVVDELNRPVSGATLAIREAKDALPHIVVDRLERVGRAGFAIFGVQVEESAQPLHLEVGGDFVVQAAPIEFAPGTRNLVATVLPAGHLVAEFLLPHDVPAERLGAALRKKGEQRRIFASQWKTQGSGYGEVRWFGLAAGEYELLVQLPGAKEPKVLLEGLRVRAAERCPDPRLLGLTLR